jgi:zinc protease
MSKILAFELLQKSLNQPRFDEEPFERMRKSNLSRIRASLSDPDWLAARIMNDRAYENHPYAKNSGGTLTTLQTLTPVDAHAFHDANILKNNIVVGVSGDITAEELKSVLDQIFGSLPEKEMPQGVESTALQNKGSVFVYTQDIPQSTVSLMLPGLDHKDPHYHTAEVMNYIFGGGGFGSRLMNELREKRGLTYGAYSSLFTMDGFNGLRISTSTRNENVGEVLNIIRDQMNAFVSDTIAPQTLTDAKTYLTGSVLLSLTSTNAIASTLLSLQLDDLPTDYLERRAEAIEAVTTDDIHALSKTLLNPDEAVTVLVGSPEKTDAMTMIKDLPNVE